MEATKRMEHARSGGEGDVVHIEPLALDAVSAEERGHLDEVHGRGAVGREDVREELLAERRLVCIGIERRDRAVELHLVFRLRDGG